MLFNLFIWILEYPPKADLSAHKAVRMIKLNAIYERLFYATNCLVKTIKLNYFLCFSSFGTLVGAALTAGPIQTVWIFTNSRMPNEDSSRP